jgi:isopenicillin N synthase-like dioxygenase
MCACEIKTPIPQLDLRRFEAGEAQRAAFLAELRTAAHEVGFFYVTGHDVETRLRFDLMEVARRFFTLPDADKLSIEMVNSPHFRGYNRVASERTRGEPDWREQIDIGAERPAIPRAGRPPPCKCWYAFCGLSRLRSDNPATRSNPCMVMTRTTW